MSLQVQQRETLHRNIESFSRAPYKQRVRNFYLPHHKHGTEKNPSLKRDIASQTVTF